MSLHTMYDDANEQLYPTGAYAYAGYIDGYADFDWLRQNRSGAHLLSITVRGNATARCIDVEPGASTQGQIPGFLDHWKGRNEKPVLYLMAGQAGGICGWLSGLGHKRSSYVLWTAHVGQGEHICGPATCGYGPGSNGTQWTWTAMGRSLDQSIIDDSFFEPPKPKPVPHELKTGFWRQVAGETTPTESLLEWCTARNQKTRAIFAHSLGKDSPINSHNRKELEAYRTKGVHRTMPHGLVFFSYHA